MSDTFEAAVMLTILRYLPAFRTPSLRSVWRLFRHQRDARRLLDLDEAALRDIGLMREDITRTLSDPQALDPTGRLGQLARDRRDLQYRKWRDNAPNRR